MKSFKNGLWLLLLAGLAGCDSPADRVFKEQIQIANDMADRIESGKFDPVCGQSIQSQTMENLKRQEKLKLSAEERKQLEEKYKPDMEKATARLRTAWQKMTGKPRSPILDMSPPNAPEANKPVDKGKEPTEEPKS